MGKIFEVDVTVPEGMKAGDTFTVAVEAPTTTPRTHGQLHGIALADMTDEQLKREIVNANSVLYKAVQRGASEETIAANQARLDAAKAERDLRTPVTLVPKAAPAEIAASTVYATPEVASEPIEAPAEAPKNDKKSKKDAPAGDPAIMAEM